MGLRNWLRCSNRAESRIGQQFAKLALDSMRVGHLTPPGRGLLDWSVLSMRRSLGSVVEQTEPEQRKFGQDRLLLLRDLHSAWALPALGPGTSAFLLCPSGELMHSSRYSDPIGTLIRVIQSRRRPRYGLGLLRNTKWPTRSRANITKLSRARTYAHRFALRACGPQTHL